MIEIDASLPPEIVPLSWLLGVWEGTGVVHYQLGEETLEQQFGHRVSFSHDGLSYLNYSSFSWLLNEDLTPLVSETGYWRLSRPIAPGEPGPAMLPGVGEPYVPTVETVEALRNPQGGFDLEVAIVHPDGVSEVYLGAVGSARIDLATDAVVRTANAKPYAAATRLYGLVDKRLLWAWDIAALGQGLRSHASGSLDRVD
jgi:THAP4-like, heme-binding beta-barrel domain